MRTLWNIYIKELKRQEIEILIYALACGRAGFRQMKNASRESEMRFVFYTCDKINSQLPVTV